jgi:heme-degrading monooxygenase HmoA
MTPHPQVVRVWTGATRAADAGEYEQYLLATGLAGYRDTPGNRAAYFTRRDQGELTEFCLITVWESMSAVRAFAGDQPDRAVFYPKDEQYLVDRDLTVAHYEVFAQSQPQ